MSRPEIAMRSAHQALLVIVATLVPCVQAASGDEAYSALRRACAAAIRDVQDHDAARVCARLASEVGAHEAAAAIAPPASLDTRAAQAAAWVRWGAAVPPASRAERYAGTDRAIALLDGLIAEAQSAGRRDLLPQLRGDRAVALRDRKRWQDSLDEVASMRAAAMPVRAYVRHAEADALLALRRPAEARVAYAEVLAQDPGNAGAMTGRFYAEVEDEDFVAAFATIDEFGRGQEPTRLAANGERVANARWLDAQVLAAQGRHYAGMHADAWSRIAPLAAGAPALGYLRAAKASVAAARGWTRLAHEEIETAAGLAPDDLGTAVALAESHLRRRNVGVARAMAAEFARAQPEDAAVLRLTRELKDFDRAAWQFDLRGRQESGGAAAAPGPGYEASARLWSAPIADAWRLFAGAGTAVAKPPEGRAERTQAGAGLEWRGPDVTAEASAWANGGSLSRDGYAAAIAWSPDDYWTVGADYERYARETPLRALLYGTTADGGGVSVGYAWHESRAVWVGARQHDFSDGNRRRQARLAWAERIVTTPAWQATLRPEVYASRNTLAGVAYFNPSRDLAVSVALDAEGLIRREYEASLRQRIGVRAGRYRQEGYADGWVGGASYAQSWQPHPRLEVRYGVEYGRARYDGAGENFLIAFLTAAGRF